MRLGHIPSAKAIGLIAILSGIGGTFGDAMHVLTGVDGYPGGGMAVWVPFLFGGAGTLLAVTHPWLDPIFSTLFGKARHQRLGVARPGINTAGLLLLLALWGTSGIIPLATGGAKDVFIAVAALGIWALVDRTLSGLMMSITCALGGVAVELALVHAGAFFYTPEFSNFFGVPSWLGWLYVAAGPTVGNLGRILSRPQGQ
jgi:hypothetical protein